MPVTRHRFRCLTDQKTSRIIWLVYDHDNRKGPIFDPTLNFHKINTLTDLNVWQEYCNYKLFLGAGGTVKVDPNDDLKNDIEEFKRIQLLRAKATAIEHLEGALEYHYEKQGYGYTYMLDNIKVTGITEDWINLVSAEYQCSAADSKKLLEFKIKEYNNLIFNLESIRLSYTNKIVKCITVDEVSNTFNLAMTESLITNRTTISSYESIAKKIGPQGAYFTW